LVQLSALKEKYKWPDKPTAERYVHGWNNEANFALFEAYVKPDLKCIVELGTWFGASTQWFAEHALDAQIYTIDSYAFKPEWVAGIKETGFQQSLPKIKECFYANLWNFRDRVTFIHNLSVPGLREIKQDGIDPDLIYIDAGHDYESVKADLLESVKLFPDAQLIGDDWQLHGVARAVLEYAESAKKKVKLYNGRCWALV
jgi:hypothetical protein